MEGIYSFKWLKLNCFFELLNCWFRAETWRQWLIINGYWAYLFLIFSLVLVLDIEASLIRALENNS